MADIDHREGQDLFERAFTDAPIGMALVALDGSFLKVNGALCELLGRSRDELLATDFQSITHPEDLERDLVQLRGALAGMITGYQLDKRYVRPGGQVIWASLSVSVAQDADGDPAYFISQLQDISVQKEAEAELRRYAARLEAQAATDALTGLLHGREFDRHVDRELERSVRHAHACSLVVLDVEPFAELARPRGTVAGDDALRLVARVLAEQSRASDVVARTGAAEFSLLLPETSEAAARTAVERVLEALRDVDGAPLIACGVAGFPGSGTTRELLRIRAAADLYAHRSILAAHGGDEERGTGVARVLELARSQLGVPLVYLTAHTATEQRVEVVAGDAAALGIAAGMAVPLAETHCEPMLAGLLPNLVADCATEPAAARLERTVDGRVRGYAGVPVRLPDGRLHGTLCAVDARPRPDLGERDLALLRFLADTVAERIEHDERERASRRAQSETAGMHALLAALDARDHYTSEHSRDVVTLAAAVAERLGLHADALAIVKEVALLHDVGKVGIPDAVLQKRGPLNEEERELMRQHPVVGARVVEATSSLAHLAPAIRAEHERWDGAGYPDGIAGTDIPLASRIVLACDAYHAMTSDRPYRAAMDAAAASEELRAGAGSQFDPTVVEALLAVLAGGDPLG